MYMAWLCYGYTYEDDEDDEDGDVTIEFTEPCGWKYAKVIPIQFNVLHQWANKDKELYK